MVPEAAERWIVNLILQARLEARIDSEKNRVQMAAAPPSLHQLATEKTRNLGLRSGILIQNLARPGYYRDEDPNAVRGNGRGRGRGRGWVRGGGGGDGGRDMMYRSQNGGTGAVSRGFNFRGAKAASGTRRDLGRGDNGGADMHGGLDDRRLASPTGALGGFLVRLSLAPFVWLKAPPPLYPLLLLSGSSSSLAATQQQLLLLLVKGKDRCRDNQGLSSSRQAGEASSSSALRACVEERQQQQSRPLHLDVEQPAAHRHTSSNQQQSAAVSSSSSHQQQQSAKEAEYK
ncbi:hypothetical protein Emed_001810 [Eimeria media]